MIRAAILSVIGGIAMPLLADPCTPTVSFPIAPEFGAIGRPILLRARVANTCSRDLSIILTVTIPQDWFQGPNTFAFRPDTGAPAGPKHSDDPGWDLKSNQARNFIADIPPQKMSLRLMLYRPVDSKLLYSLTTTDAENNPHQADPPKIEQAIPEKDAPQGPLVAVIAASWIGIITIVILRALGSGKGTTVRNLAFAFVAITVAVVGVRLGLPVFIKLGLNIQVRDFVGGLGAGIVFEPISKKLATL